MEITIKRSDQKFQFTAANDSAEIDVCATPELGDDPKGFRPMELQLVALGGCMSIDVLQILYKQRQKVDDYSVKVSGERTGGLPNIFKTVHIDLFLYGEITSSKIEQAIQLSIEKYCSVYAILDKTASITCNYHLNDGK